MDTIDLRDGADPASRSKPCATSKQRVTSEPSATPKPSLMAARAPPRTPFGPVARQRSP
jgi:hypothetical protein